ncbi:MAG: hypothetical protein ACTJGV_01815 [Proteus vulgaris]
MNKNKVKSYHQKTEVKGGDAMINTNDLKVLNTNLDKQFDVVIYEKIDLDGKSSWFIQLQLHHKDDHQELYTFAGHLRYFKTLDFCLKFVQENCNNAKHIYIVCADEDGRKIEVFSSEKKFNRTK